MKTGPEFGAKVALAQTITDGIIVGTLNAFNEYDGNCLAPLLDQIEETTGKCPACAYCDRGFRGRMLRNYLKGVSGDTINLLLARTKSPENNF